MVKVSWGTKRTCTCGIRFYDLNKKEIECPGCGETINVETLSISSLENNLRKKPHSEVLEKKNRKEIKDKDLPKNKNPDVEINTDDVSKTEVDEIVADQIESKEKKE